MNRVRLLLFSLFLMAANASAGGPVYQVGVDGLACPFCAYGIEKHLQKLDGVQAVEVDLEMGNVIITMQDGEPLARIRAEQAVERAGFTLRSFEQTKEYASP